MSLSFHAKALLLRRTEEGWKEENITIDSIEDIRKIFTPYESDVSQVNINKYMKVYYCIKFLENEIEARVTDIDCDTHYMVSPLLLVECNDTNPIDLSDDTLEKMRDIIDFY